MEQQKKMNLLQLTFIVAVNMMGSGIIMLPTDMAKVGAISLLSWIVTALGSMAIAYGFAQAGLFINALEVCRLTLRMPRASPAISSRFFSIFLGDRTVAIAISAVGYLATFFPWLSSTPIATCLDHRFALVDHVRKFWRTQLAADRRDHSSGRHYSSWIAVHYRLVLVQVDEFEAAWNPHGYSLLEGMGSSIALTLWAFLGWNLRRKTQPRWRIRSATCPWHVFRHAGCRRYLHPIHDGFKVSCRMRS